MSKVHQSHAQLSEPDDSLGTVTVEKLAAKAGSSWTDVEIECYLEYLYLHKYTELVSVAGHRLGSREDPEDAWGAFVTEQARTAISLYQPDGGRGLYSWIVHKFDFYCRSVKRRHLSKPKEQPLLEPITLEIDTKNAVADPTAAYEALDLVQKVLGSLTLEEQHLFAARFLEGKSYRRIAVELGIPEGTAKSRVYTLRKKLPAVVRDLEQQRCA